MQNRNGSISIDDYALLVGLHASKIDSLQKSKSNDDNDDDIIDGLEESKTFVKTHAPWLQKAYQNAVDANELVAKDKNKANYFGQLRPLSQKMNEDSELKQTQKEKIIYSSADPKFTSRTNRIYNMLTGFTLGRITVVGMYLVGGWAAAVAWPIKLSMLSMSFAADVLLDLGISLKRGFGFGTGANRGLKGNLLSRFWYRFTEALGKDNRPYRLRNGIAWAAINVTCFVLSWVWAPAVAVTAPAMAAKYFIAAGALTFSGFVYDIWNAYYTKKQKVTELTALHNKLDNDPSSQKLVSKEIENTKDSRARSMFTALAFLVAGVGLFSGYLAENMIKLSTASHFWAAAAPFAPGIYAAVGVALAATCIFAVANWYGKIQWAPACLRGSDGPAPDPAGMSSSASALSSFAANPQRYENNGVASLSSSAAAIAASSSSALKSGKPSRWTFLGCCRGDDSHDPRRPVGIEPRGEERVLTSRV